jgi:hypothetical protein
MTIVKPRNEIEVLVCRESSANDLDAAASVLEHAAEILDSVGWIQGQFGGELSGGYCAIGAISTASVNPRSGARRTASNMADAVTEGDDIIAFNDAEGRRKRDVQRKLRKAARRARALARAMRLGKVSV